MNDRDRFDKFTERARKVLSLAQEEAQRFQHNYIGTEHLLLGLVREGEGVAAKVLSNLGVELNKVRSAVEFIIGRGDRIVFGEIGLTPRAKKVIELAVDEAHRLNHHYIGTEHLLLGLIREDEGIAAQALHSLGVNLEKVRTHTIQVLSQSGAPHVVSRSRFSQTHFIQSVMEVGDERFDTFTVQVSRVLSRAEEEAQRFQHNYLGSEHLLLALVGESKGVAARVLSSLSVELNNVRSQVEFIISDKAHIVPGQTGLTPQVKKVIELAVDEARLLNHHYVGIEHLLLGLIREGEGIAAGVLESLGVTLEKARIETLRVLGEEGGQQQSQDDKESMQAPGEESTASTQQPIQDDDDKVQELSQEEKIFIQTLGVLSQVDRDTFEKFTVRARRVLRFSREEAQSFQHNYIGTEHLLLGLVRENGGIAAVVLRNLGVEPNKVRSSIEFITGRGNSIVLGTPGLTPRSKKVIELAADEARRLNHDYIGTEHLLLGLVREGEGIAVGVLESLGVRLGRVRTETVKVLNQQKKT
jgi:ATP-dependent Clp protease ATP-binding subunit ClpA